MTIRRSFFRKVNEQFPVVESVSKLCNFVNNTLHSLAITYYSSGMAFTKRKFANKYL